MNDDGIYARNMQAEIQHNEKTQREKEAYEVTIEDDGIIVTSTDYSRKTTIIAGLESGPIFKKARKNAR
jgi:hypothetical protein